MFFEFYLNTEYIHVFSFLFFWSGVLVWLDAYRGKGNEQRVCKDRSWWLFRLLLRESSLFVKISVRFDYPLVEITINESLIDCIYVFVTVTFDDSHVAYRIEDVCSTYCLFVALFVI